MRPESPTPFETAQWIIETHAENIVGEMTDNEQDAYLTELRLVCDSMSATDLRSALGAVVDMTQELLLELVESDVEADRLLTLVRQGRGRTHVTKGLPARPSVIGAASAFRLAATIARTCLWSHLASDCDDEEVLDLFDADCEDVRVAIRERRLGHLWTVGAYLQAFSRTLKTEKAEDAADPGPTSGAGGDVLVCRSPDGAGCRGHIDDWAAVIEERAETIFDRTGSMDPLWSRHEQFFGRPDPSPPVDRRPARGVLDPGHVRAASLVTGPSRPTSDTRPV